MATTYPRKNENGDTVWACCESSIGPVCNHLRLELPPNFSMQGEHVVSPAYGSFMRVWTVKEYPLHLKLSNSEFRKVSKLGACYLTAAMGRQGWNIRKSFPTNYVERTLPFIMVRSDGAAFHFSHRGSTVRKANFSLRT